MNLTLVIPRPALNSYIGAVLAVVSSPVRTHQLRKRSSQPAPERGGKMNNNVNSERAHLGVFSTASYINIGDPYGTKPKERDPRLLGKQFSMAVPKQGIAGARPNNSMFDREHKWLFNGEKCASRPCLAPGSSEQAGRARWPQLRSLLHAQELAWSCWGSSQAPRGARA